MLYIDKKYAQLSSVYLKRFKEVRTNLYNFRCPFCGDSKKNEVKTRGYLFEDENKLYFKCWNCGLSKTMAGFLDDLNPELAKEYKFEKLKESGYNFRRNSNAPVVDQSIKKKLIEKSKSMTDRYDIVLGGIPLNKLPDGHKCLEYVKSRNIPKEYYNYLQYTDRFSDLVKKFVKDNIKLPNDERLVIPVYNMNKELTHVQGRALSSDSKIRYITVTVKQDAPKIFGLDRIIHNKPKYVVEGPLDSLFIPNSIAVMDSCLHKRGTIPKDYILIHDCQPRNKEIVNQMKSSINLGYSVCMLPEGYGKDINDMINNGLSKDELMDIIAKHTYKGLSADVAFGKWKKI